MASTGGKKKQVNVKVALPGLAMNVPQPTARSLNNTPQQGNAKNSSAQHKKQVAKGVTIKKLKKTNSVAKIESKVNIMPHFTSVRKSVPLVRALE